MFNEQHKKERPVLGLLGMGGGIARGGSAAAENTGGTIVTDGGTTYHIFMSNDVFEVSTGPLSATILAIGGGGSGGDSQGGAGSGGGGGAGGLVNAPFTINNGSYPVTVGPGGGTRVAPSAPLSPYPNTQYAGSPSVVNTIVTAYGGGAGGGHGRKPGTPGGSGGGPQDSNYPKGEGDKQTGTSTATGSSPGQGNPSGELSSGSGQRGGAGGGGAGGSGTSGTGTVGGNGGTGVDVGPTFPGPVIGPVVPGFGGHVCGGGYGGGSPDNSQHVAQTPWGGGGRSTPNYTNVEEGRDYSGGGGGASPVNMPAAERAGKAGGKGLVIIKY